MLHHSEKYNVGVIVGRFQVHELHPGHRELLDWVNTNHDTMIVVLGCSGIVSQTNPLPFNARRAMIAEQYPNAIIVPIYDQRSDDIWSKDLDQTIRRSCRPTETVCLYGSRDGFMKHYSGKYATQELVSSEPYWSGTKVREEIQNKVLSSSDFRSGVIYAQGGGYPKVIPTVDVILFNTDIYSDDFDDKNKAVYMVRKHGEDKFRFPGGYAEPGASYMITAKREIKEEVGDLEVDLQYFDDVEIKDWRYGERDIIHTTIFIGHRLWGSIGNFKDTDEIAEVRPFTLTNLLFGYQKSIVEEHHIIVEKLKAHLEKSNKMVDAAKKVLEENPVAEGI